MIKTKATIIFLTVTLFSFAQIPVENYKQEISNLKTEKEIASYWKKIEKIDQEVLVKTLDIQEADSISTDNMIKTALLFKIHGNNAYKPYNTVPILNLSHNNVCNNQIAFWNIIEQCKNVGGIIESFGGKYPSYQLESISMCFYNYSLYGQDSIYNKLANKMSLLTDKNVVENLLKSYNNTKKTHKLKEVKILSKWYLQPFKNVKEKEVFELVLMSDNNLYIRKKKRIQKLILISKCKNSKTYRLENEPFDWYYKLSNGNLSLLDENDKVLIEYTEA